MPRYFRRLFRGYFRYGGAAASRGFGWFGVVSGPVFRACLPARRRPWFAPFPGRLRRCCRGAAGPPPGLPESWPGGRLFCPFCPAFSGPEGGAGGPGRGEKLPDREKRTCVKKVRGGIQLRVVRVRHACLCAMNVCSERMLTSARFSATAQLGRVCKKSVRPRGRGVQGGSLSKKTRLN